MSSNYAGAVISAVAPIISLPFFLKAVGTECWGIVAILTMTVSLLGMVDAGFSQVLTREFSIKYDPSKKNNEALCALFVSFKTIYLIAAVIVAISIPLISDKVVHLWLNINDDLAQKAKMALVGAGLISALQIGSAPQRALLIGLGSHFSLNVVSIFANMFKYFGGAIALMYFPSVYIIILFFILGALIEFLARGYIAEKKIMIVWRLGVSWGEVKPIFPRMLTMSGAVAISLLAMQADKLIVSYMLSIKDFSVYSIASSISMGALQFIYPMMTTFSPEIYQSSNNPDVLKSVNRKIAIILLAGATICWIIFIKYGELILLAWLSDKELVSFIYYPMSFLLAGVTINAFYNICYLNWIAFGKSQIILKINLASLFVTLIIMPVLIKQYGINGAAASLALVNLLMFGISMLLCFRKEN